MGYAIQMQIIPIIHKNVYAIVYINYNCILYGYTILVTFVPHTKHPCICCLSVRFGPGARGLEPCVFALSIGHSVHTHIEIAEPTAASPMNKNKDRIFVRASVVCYSPTVNILISLGVSKVLKGSTVLT